MDGYSAHISYKNLQIFHEHNIIVCGLPAHKLQVLRPLDVRVFGQVNEEFRRIIIRRTVTTMGDIKDISKICGLLSLEC